MSDLIRTARTAFLSMPPGSRDVRAAAGHDMYAELRRISEREQRANDRNVNRLIRASRRSTPAPFNTPIQPLNPGLTQVTGVLLTIEG